MTKFVERVTGVQHALAVSPDGLLAASSAGLGRDPADTAAAVTANLAVLAKRSASLLEGGRAALTMIETVEGFVLLMPTSDGAVVVAWAVRPCDVGQIGYELAVLAAQCGPEGDLPQ
jgi:predicted regulator of Ras-like GTPase activity (Roadblock/LC7/MglB family)